MEFYPNSKRKRNSKIFLAGSSILLLLLLILFFVQAQYNRLRNFDLYCEIPFGILILSLSIANDIYALTREKLILTSNQISYQTFGLFINVPWNEIEGIKNDPAWIRRNIECLFFDKNFAKTSWLWFYSLQDKNLIPLTIFDENWRNSDLGQKLKQYAPHLFEKRESADQFIGEPT
jgi:hypothetical protein